MVPYMRYFTYPARRVLSWSCLLILTETAYDDWLIAMTPPPRPPDPQLCNRIGIASLFPVGPVVQGELALIKNSFILF